MVQCTYIRPPGTPCLRVCQDALLYTPGYTLAWLSYALGCMSYPCGIMIPHMGNKPLPICICPILLYTLDYSLL